MGGDLQAKARIQSLFSQHSTVQRVGKNSPDPKDPQHLPSMVSFSSQKRLTMQAR